MEELTLEALALKVQELEQRINDIQRTKKGVTLTGAPRVVKDYYDTVTKEDK